MPDESVFSRPYFIRSQCEEERPSTGLVKDAIRSRKPRKLAQLVAPQSPLVSCRQLRLRYGRKGALLGTNDAVYTNLHCLASSEADLPR